MGAGERLRVGGRDGQPTADYLLLESLLDSFAGEELALTLERGGETIDVKLKSEDLHQITPDNFVGGCGGVFHPFRSGSGFPERS